MGITLTYRGRAVTESDVAFLRELIAANPRASRRQLSRLVCEAWQWRQQNGQLRDMVCRSLMLALDRSGHIALPPVRRRPVNNVVVRPRPGAVSVDESPLCATLGALGPLTIEQVRRTDRERLFDRLVADHHYLGYMRPVGEHLKYVVFAGERPVACLSWSSAPRHLGPRDRFIGWSAEARRKNIRFLAYNTRFLILPWVEVPHLASHLLGRVTRRIATDWEQVYGHPVYYLESFVEPGRFQGTCYRAANWIFLGRTTGRGKDDHTNRPNRPLKEVLGYPLARDFRDRLGRVA